MIGCDNDLCPIEWFHFNCVQLSCKPKGKWYCPKCRGDKQTVMKPRAQFLKELAIFNKEREAKMMTKQLKNNFFSRILFIFFDYYFVQKNPNEFDYNIK